MRQTWRWPLRRTMVASGALILLLGVVSSASAAKPDTPDPEVTVSISNPTCDAPNHLTVTADVDTNVDLTSFDIQVSRWENVTSSDPDVFDGFGQVENWSANFWNDARKGPSIPESHTLTTDDAATWSFHSWRTTDAYDESSDLFVVGVSAIGAGKGNTGRTGQWGEWVVDCTNPGSPQILPYTSMWEGEWLDNEGSL